MAIGDDDVHTLDGLTMTTTVPVESAKLTQEDLIKGREEFPKYSDEQMIKHDPPLYDERWFDDLCKLIDEIPEREEARRLAHIEFIQNQDRWQRVIMNDHRCGRTDRIKHLMRSMQAGAPFPGAVYSYCGIDEVKLPRFMRLRRHLFKETIK